MLLGLAIRLGLFLGACLLLLFLRIRNSLIRRSRLLWRTTAAKFKQDRAVVGALNLAHILDIVQAILA